MPAQEDTRVDKPLGGVPDAGSVHEEVVVAAALYVRKKDPTTLRRQKREIRLVQRSGPSSSPLLALLCPHPLHNQPHNESFLHSPGIIT